MCDYYFLHDFRYFSVVIFCNIGLPGFAVSLGMPIVAFVSIILSLIVIDKVKMFFIIIHSVLTFVDVMRSLDGSLCS